MCRHLAYLGPPVALHEMLFGAPHALCEQALGPRHQTSGDSNPDGWGVGWYVNGQREPNRYRTVTPIWEDREFADAARVIESGAFVAAARLASPGATIEDTGNAPFFSGPWLFSLNGAVGGFTKGVGDELRAGLSATRLAGIEGDSDSEVLFALTLDRLDAGDAPAAALSYVVDRVTNITKARLNMLLSDGHLLAATRVGNSLFVHGATVASEPLDAEPGWREVPEGSVVFAMAEGADNVNTITPL
jgi:gamma-glutamyl hercynylcysteine S-oxide hydrolase